MGNAVIPEIKTRRALARLHHKQPSFSQRRSYVHADVGNSSREDRQLVVRDVVQCRTRIGAENHLRVGQNYMLLTGIKQITHTHARTHSPMHARTQTV